MPAKNWKVVRSSHSLPQVYSEDGEECITDRVFNGCEDLIAVAPEMRDELDTIHQLVTLDLDNPTSLRASLLTASGRIAGLLARANRIL